jgi:hypothetical protein
VAKRVRAVYIDEPHRSLNNMDAWFGKLRRFSTPTKGGSHIFTDSHDMLQETWEKLGKPHKLRITITSMDD